MVKSQFLTVRRAVVVTVVVASRDDRRPISRLRAAAATMMRRASLKKKVGYLPNQSKGTFWCGFVWAKTRLIRSTKKDVSSSSSSCLPCKFWNEPPLDFFMAPLSSSSSFSSKVVVAGGASSLQQVVLCDNTQRRGSFLFEKTKICAWFKGFFFKPKNTVVFWFGNAKKKGSLKGPIDRRSAKKRSGKRRRRRRKGKREAMEDETSFEEFYASVESKATSDQKIARVRERTKIGRFAITCKQTGEIIPLVNFSNLREELAEILGPHLVDWEDEGKRELLFRNCKPWEREDLTKTIERAIKQKG